MANIILLFTCLFLGFFFKKSNLFPKETPVVLNKFVIYISLPAMALHYLPKIELSPKLLYPIGAAWIGFFIAFGLFASLGKWLGWSKKLTGCLILTSGLGNTSFIGIPVIEALYGKEGLETLVLVDLPGSFIMLSTLGIVVATTYSRGKTNLKQIGRQIISFPPFIAFIIGILLILLNQTLPETIDGVFEKLSYTISPLALVSVGYQINLEKRSKHWNFLILGLTYQLILWPLIILVLYKVILNQSGTAINVCIMEAGMAPMITASIVASAYGLKPKLSNMMVSIGIPISFITLAFWYWVLTVV
ncbi:AEC family transporter [Mangrovimonas spongiae]|uniref:AEC family transporter n=1 Tax=Mangrovimonas spongiae TaxID=2494697 RepID=A0A3R9NTW5_9FLAO|nr:AEC family transporter [Mangrovimonas spongiae]RSK41631.1 AEC family transporter [Mangrovimonas spongiae]